MSRREPSELHFRMAGAVGAALLGGLGRTLRFRRTGEENFLRFRREGRPVVFTFWHSRMVPLAHLHRGKGIVVLVSRHRDGEYIARLVARNGFGLARGSSTRGGAKGLRELIRALRQGRDVAVTPDGPRGPERVFKPGALAAAQAAGAPVIPLAVTASRAWWLSSWDHFMIPQPFARLDVRYGKPRWVPRSAGEKDRASLARELSEEMNREPSGRAVGDVSLSEAPGPAAGPDRGERG